MTKVNQEFSVGVQTSQNSLCSTQPFTNTCMSDCLFLPLQVGFFLRMRTIYASSFLSQTQSHAYSRFTTPGYNVQHTSKCHRVCRELGYQQNWGASPSSFISALSVCSDHTQIRLTSETHQQWSQLCCNFLDSTYKLSFHVIQAIGLDYSKGTGHW